MEDRERVCEGKTADCLNLKKQLTADERRYTLRNQNLETIIGLTKKVDL